MSRLSGRTAIIVGSATGAGRATALRFAAEGAQVVVADVNEAGAKEVVDEIGGLGAEAIAVTVDLRDEESIREMIRVSLERFSKIDILHNNAAALHLISQDRDLCDLEAGVIDDTFAVNVRGPMLTCKHVIPTMLAAGRGVIINTASMAGVQADDGLVAYSASKAALMSLTRSIATLYGRKGIRCNTIAPNLMLTKRAIEKFSAEDLRLKLSERLLSRLGTPEDLAGVALFLATEESSYIQGQVIVMDGGDSVHRPKTSVDAWHELAGLSAEELIS